MNINLTLRQITELCVNNFLEIEVKGEIPKPNEVICIDYKDIEINGLVKRLRADGKKIIVELQRIETNLKTEWFSCVRSLGKVDVQESIYLIHMMLNKLSWAGKWEDIDELIGMVDAEKEDLDIVLSFLMCTHTKVAVGFLKNRSTLYEVAFPRLQKVITTPGVLDRLKNGR